LGDGKYVTDAPKKGYVYLCHPNEEGGGAEKDGSWIHGNTWNANEKLSVTGDVAWPNASFSMKTGNGVRSIAMNDLPTTVHTGTFPIGANDPAYQFDRNPNAIRSQSLTFALSLSPKKLASPGCIGIAIGVIGGLCLRRLASGVRNLIADAADPSHQWRTSLVSRRVFSMIEK
jgi:hypothetical protein